MADSLDGEEAWSAVQLRLCGEYGVYEWCLGTEWGGQQCDEVEGRARPKVWGTSLRIPPVVGIARHFSSSSGVARNP